MALPETPIFHNMHLPGFHGKLFNLSNISHRGTFAPTWLSSTPVQFNLRRKLFSANNLGVERIKKEQLSIRRAERRFRP